MFSPRMISEMENEVFFNVYKANTSIPSKAAPALMISPIPMPRKTPPKIEISSLSLVTATSGSNVRQMPKRITLKKVRKANLWPTEKKLTTINGRFSTIITKARLKW